MMEGKRQLCAIMFTDIVGYSALSHRNEPLALELLEIHRRIARPFFARHRGVEIKTIGDAFLVKFESALDAVRCAIEVQSALREYNASHPRERRIQIRIGIHLGDVLASENDVYGDGVNIAARLQYVARPGGICISGTVFDQVRSQVPHTFILLKVRKLKNIEKPMRIYGISLTEPAKETARVRIQSPLVLLNRASLRQKLAWAAPAALSLALGAVILSVREVQAPAPTMQASPASAEQRIAVLPFENISQETDDEYLSEGMTEELISSLSRLKRLRVLAKSTVTRYKKAEKNPNDVGRELNVATLVEGSVRKLDDRLRISVKVIDAGSQESVWSRDFDGKVGDLFDIQRRISREISGHFNGGSDAGRALASAPRSVPGAVESEKQKQAYLLYLQGRYFMARRTHEGLRKGIATLEQSLKLNPGHAPSYGALANAYGLLGYYGALPPVQVAQTVTRHAERALELDPQLAEALISLAETRAYFHHDWARAEKTFLKALEADPSHATAHQWFGEFLVYRGRNAEAQAQSAIAIRLDPLSLVTHTAAGVVAFFSGDAPRAISDFRRIIAMDPAFVLPHYWLGRALLATGKPDEAAESLRKAVELSQGAPMMRAALAHALARMGSPATVAEARELLRGLERDSRARYVSPYDLALVHLALGDEAAALDNLERSEREHDIHFPKLAIDPALEPLRAHPRAAALLAKLR